MARAEAVLQLLTYLLLVFVSSCPVFCFLVHIPHKNPSSWPPIFMKYWSYPRTPLLSRVRYFVIAVEVL